MSAILPTILLVELMLAIYLVGVLIVAISVTMRHGDSTATYRLYAIRDELIDLVVFKGVDRENPWLEALYENINLVLSHPIAKRRLHPFPNRSSEDCPEVIRALAPELLSALKHLRRNHLGPRILRENAKNLLQMMTTDLRCERAAQ